MRISELTFVTGNEDKIREAERIVGRRLATAAVDLVEIQSLDLVAVARAKAVTAHEHLAHPVVVEETGLELAALGGFPGPLVKWMLAAIGPRGIAGVAAALDETAAVARCVVVAFDGEREHRGEGSTTGRLTDAPRGDGGFGWDPVFVPAGEDLTYGELPAARKDEIGHRGRAWRELVAQLDSSRQPGSPRQSTR